MVTHSYADRTGVRYMTNGLKVYYLPIQTFYNQCILPTMICQIPLLRDILIREQIEIVHGHSAFSALAHEAMFVGSLLNLRVSSHNFNSLHSLISPPHSSLCSPTTRCSDSPTSQPCSRTSSYRSPCRHAIIAFVSRTRARRTRYSELMYQRIKSRLFPTQWTRPSSHRIPRMAPPRASPSSL